MQFASIYNLYDGNIIPAFNLRVLTYDTARALFRVAKKVGRPLFIIELAQSEMAYTKQSPKSFAKDISRAAQAERYTEPIYLQGDHYKSMGRAGELEKLVKKAIKAGFYNIDIDCSALPLQENIAKTNYYIDFIKKRQPKGIIMNIGGEVGDIGRENTKTDELEEFLQKVKGISKVAVQTGTAHSKGGQIDWQLLQALSQIAKSYGLSGVVQHGASSLSESDLRKLSEYGVCEVHLATEIMNVILEHPDFPCKIQKKEIGIYAKKTNKISQPIKNKIMQAVEDKFTLFFNCLKGGVKNEGID